MPFIVRCLNPKCQKYNLVEDDRRGKTADCLVCGTTMKIEADPSAGGRPEPRRQKGESNTKGTADTPEKIVKTCPNCEAKLRVPVTTEQQRIKCPRCQTVFR